MMQTKLTEKEKAISLRKRGFSYSEILEQVPVAKSTLSSWLHSVGLSKSQKQRLTQKKLESARKGWERAHELRLERWQKTKTEAAKQIKSVSRRERWLLGIALYWAEGNKEKEYTKSTNLKFSNSDPLMIKFFQQWVLDFLNVSLNDFRYELYIHEKTDWEAAKKYWAKELNIDSEKIRVYFKRHNPKSKRKNIGIFYHGLLRVSLLGGSSFVRKIDGWVSGILEHCRVV